MGNEGDLLYKKWDNRFPEGVFLLVHGLGASVDRWKYLSEFFIRKSIPSYAMELKGFGDTEGIKGHIGSFDVYYSDILELYEIIRKENPGTKIYLVGESMGALISFITAGNNPGVFSGLICISPAFSNRLKLKTIDNLKMMFSLLFNPEKQFNVPFDADMCTRDKEMIKCIENDDKEHRFATSGLLAEIFKAQKASRKAAFNIDTPLLFLLAGHDEIVDPEASRKIFKHIKAKDKTLIEYPEMKHALSIDLDREKVFEDMYEWIMRDVG